MLAGVVVEPPARRAVHALRRARRSARLGRLEWFEVAYRAYLVVLVGGAAAVVVGGWVPATPLDAAAVDAVHRHGPSVVGLMVAVVWAVGVRSGAHGGPIAVEAPDVRYLLLSPVPRRHVLLRPCTQRLSTLATAGGLVGAVAGLLAAPRLTGSTAVWLVAGTVTGAAVAAGAVAVAVVVHALAVPLGVAHTLSAVVVAAQAAAVAWSWPGITTVVGDVALWPLTRRSSSLVAGAAMVAGVLAVVAAALALSGRLRPEALERRTSLVAQLRFALAVGDLRTVVLLRRHLTHDHLRTTPWRPVPVPGTGYGGALALLMWRSAVGLARWPVRRLARTVGLAAALGVASAGVVDGTTALIAVVAVVAFVIGLDLTEALAQTLDHSELRALVPMRSGAWSAGLLVVPALAAVPVAGVAVLGAVAVGGTRALPAGAVMAVPVLWAGMAGAVVNVVRGAPDPLARAARALSMPPEVAGLSTMVQTAWPLVVSLVGVAPLLFVADAVDHGGSLVAAAFRGAVAALLVGGAVVLWVRVRDDARRRWRALVAAGDEARRQAVVRRRERSGGAS